MWPAVRSRVVFSMPVMWSHGLNKDLGPLLGELGSQEYDHPIGVSGAFYGCEGFTWQDI